MLMVLKSYPIPLLCHESYVCIPNYYMICTPGWDKHTQEISYVQSRVFISPFLKLTLPTAFPISAKGEFMLPGGQARKHPLPVLPICSTLTPNLEFDSFQPFRSPRCFSSMTFLT